MEMDKDEARIIIRRTATFGDIIVSKGHPTNRRIERKFSIQDAQRIILGGRMVGNIKDHDEGFECSMEGPLDDGRILRIPIIVNPEEDYIIVKSFIPK